VRIRRAIRFQHIEFAARRRTLRINAARDLLAHFAFKRYTAHRLAGRALHAAQLWRNFFGELCRDDATGRIIRLSPVKGYAETGATCAAGLARVGSHVGKIGCAVPDVPRGAGEGSTQASKIYMHRFDDCIVPGCSKKVRAINLSNNCFPDMARRPAPSKINPHHIQVFIYRHGLYTRAKAPCWHGMC
jgi:hypothetical protein